MTTSVRRALISVSDKTGIVDLAGQLVDAGVELVATGGTATLLEQAGLPITPVEAVTRFPEMLDGRVKTLHPNIFAGLLARRGDSDHMDAIAAHDIAPIDLVVVNLYPFEATIAREPTPELEEAIEQVDIGGPSLLRAAAKNHADVLVVVDPRDYATVVDIARGAAAATPALRLRLAQRALRTTAAYDVAIANWLATQVDTGGDTEGALPEVLVQAWTKVSDMRYGENPHQRGAFYRPTVGSFPGALADARQLGGKPLSFNNVADTDTAWALACELAEPAVVAVKHANPCGVGTAADLPGAWKRALAADPVSIFGGIVACNRPVDAATARAMIEVFLEVVVAPGFDDDALEVLQAKPNLRLLELDVPPGSVAATELASRVDADRDGAGAGGTLTLARPTTATTTTTTAALPVLKTVRGGLLVQDPDVAHVDIAACEVVTRRAPSADELAALDLAWRTVRHVTSNAIVLVRGGATVGVGGGQTSRVDAVEIAVAHAGELARGAVLASDAFFPMADGPERAAEAGITAIIQPGGSVRDADVVAACDAAGIAMLVTGTRHFRH